MDIHAHLLRDDAGDYYTYGRLTLRDPVTGGQFTCDTLEDEGRPLNAKKPKETRVYPGDHEIILRPAGGMHERYLKHPNSAIREIHRGMLWLLNTPQFEYIYLHPGNTHLNTDGCILPGYSRGELDGLKAVLDSAEAYVDFYKMALAIFDRDDRLFISIRDPMT